MSEDVTARLRSLAKDFSHGRVGHEAYRRSRTALLDSLISKPLAASQSAAPLRPLWVAAPGDALPPAIPAGNVTRPWLRSRARWIGAAALLLLTLAIGASLVSRHSGSGAALVSRGSTTSPDRIFDLVAPLMSDPDWSEDRVAAVNAALLEEGSRQIALRQQTGWFQRFAVEVRRRLAEQRAFGTNRLVPEKSSLAALAVTIGLDPTAPDMPLRPPIGGSSAAPDSGGSREQ